MTDYSLFTTAELINELNKYTSAFALIYLNHDEDIGPKSIRTNVNCRESARLQIAGLTAKIYNWMSNEMRDRIKSSDQPKLEQFNKQDQFEVQSNSDGKEILSALKNRTEAGVAAIVFHQDYEIFYKSWEKSKGQSYGLIHELYERIINET
jgi:hypothetical protein